MKLVNENQNYWDEHRSKVFLFYKTTFKVGTNHTPCQFIYGLYPLLPIEYLLPSKPRQIYDPKLVRVLISHLSKLKELQDNWLVAHNLIASNQWNQSLWSQK
jgi:hypothetical protein